MSRFSLSSNWITAPLFLVWGLSSFFVGLKTFDHFQFEVPIPAASPIPINLDLKEGRKKPSKPLQKTLAFKSVYTKHHWIKPVAGNIINSFGNGYIYFGVYRGGHTGVDIQAKQGAAVLASSEGEVVKIHARSDRKYGLYVILDHKNGFFSLYGHLSKINVKMNQKMNQGDVLGEVGITGAAGYPHLHFEVLNQVPIRDGAYGYYYICQKRPAQNDLETYNFVNQYAMGISSIYRNKYGHCRSLKLHRPVLYFNPEHFFSPAPLPEWPLERQPENEEYDYKKRKEQFHLKQKPSKPLKTVGPKSE